MKLISFFRNKGRKIYDSIYCKTLPNKIKLGNECSWFIDTTLLHPGSIVYSGGVGNDISFELALTKKIGCDILLFDPSETGCKTMNKKENEHERLKFFPIGLDKEDGIVKFSKPENSVEGSFAILRDVQKDFVEFSCRSISSLTKEFKHQVIDLLKIDIEGFEYAVIDDILKNKIEVKQICVEFHHFFKEIPRSKTSKTIRQLIKRGYVIIHKHRSDYTFIKR